MSDAIFFSPLNMLCLWIECVLWMPQHPHGPSDASATVCKALFLKVQKAGACGKKWRARWAEVEIEIEIER